jgi:cellulose synthase operon protein C
MRLLAGLLTCISLLSQGLPPDVLEGKLAEGAESLKKRNFTNAEEVYREVLDQSGDLRAFRGLIEALAAQKRFTAAAAVVESALEKYPGQQQLRLMLASVYTGAAKHSEAVAVYRKILEKEPGNYSVLMRLGEALHETGDTEGAIATMNKAIEFAPNALVPQIQIAVFEEARGRQDVAIQMYEKLLATQPNAPALLNNLAYALAVSGVDADRALTLALRARGYLPDNREVADTYGLALVKSGDAAAGLKIFEGLIAQEPDRSAFHYGAGVAKLALGRKKDALDSAERALELKHNAREDVLIRKLLEQIKASPPTQ